MENAAYRLDQPECDCQDMVVDEEDWGVILDKPFANEPGAADAFAHLLSSLIEAIENGPQESLRAVNTLKYGIQRIYLYTEEHNLARELYELYLTGNLKPMDEPRQLLKGALRRSKSESRSEREDGE
jgi:hypothetical protein